MKCIGCQEEKPATTEFFHKSRKYDENGLHPRCKVCRIKQQREYRNKNKIKCYEASKKYQNKVETKIKYSATRYGITSEECLKLYNDCNGQCGICSKPISFGAEDRNEKVCIDHCHETDRIRGILCHPCNCALGLMQDDIERLQKAIAYLT